MDSLDLLRTFQEVARLGSFARAAHRLDLAKANVSKHIARLEQHFGTRLFHRTTRAVRLTDAGALLLARSEPLLAMMDATRAELQGRAHAPAGRLRISAPHGLAPLGLHELLADFMARHPAVTVSLQLSNRLIDMVDEGIDLALRIGAIGDANLIVRKLRPAPFVVAAAPDYWAAHGVPREPDDLADHQVLSYSAAGSPSHWRFQVDGRPHSVAVAPRMDATDGAPLVAAALRGQGVILIPRLLIEAQLAAGELQPQLEAFIWPDTWLHAAYTQRRHTSAALKALLDALQARWGQPAA